MSKLIALPEVAKWLQTNPWVIVVTCVLSVMSFIGVPLAVIFYVKSRREKSPCFAMRSFNVFRDYVSQIEGLEIKYGGLRVETLTVTHLLFWNRGREPIRREDVASSDPIAIAPRSGCNILHAECLQVKKEANRFCVTMNQDDSSAVIDFDYVAKDEGVVLELVHTGKASSDLSVRGTIIGASAVSNAGDVVFPSVKVRGLTLHWQSIRWSFVMVLLVPLLCVTLSNVSLVGRANKLVDSAANNIRVLSLSKSERLKVGFQYYLMRPKTRHHRLMDNLFVDKEATAKERKRLAEERKQEYSREMQEARASLAEAEAFRSKVFSVEVLPLFMLWAFSGMWIVRLLCRRVPRGFDSFEEGL